MLTLAAGHPPLNLVSLPDPASPERAALQAGRPLDQAALLSRLRSLLAPGPTLVEGVGGGRVPLDARHDVADLRRTLACRCWWWWATGWACSTTPC